MEVTLQPELSCPNEQRFGVGKGLGTGIALASLEALLADENGRVKGVVLEAHLLQQFHFDLHLYHLRRRLVAAALLHGFCVGRTS